MDELNNQIIGNQITVNHHHVFFEEPYGVYLKENFQRSKTFELNWLYDIILFFIHSNEKNNTPTTAEDIIHFFDKSRIFYLQKNPIPPRHELERIVLDLLLKLANEQCISFQNTF